jgi:membrane-bound serine protease (ClpP class)
MRRKVINDAAAYIRSLAEQRGRNVEWAEQAVREAVSLSAEEALKEGVIEYIAEDLEALLKQLDGQTIKINSEKTVTLDLSNVRVETFTPDWRLQFLAAISDPSIAYILLMLGIYGIVFEFLSPGFGVAGTLGAIFLLTALFGLQMLPINYAGFALIFLGIALLVAELFLPTFGLLGLGGIVAFVLGSILLFDSDIPGFDVPYVTIFSAAVSLFLLFLFLMFYVVRGSFGTATKVSGKEQLLHSIGEATEDFHGEGRIRLLGESWRAHSQVFVKRGQKVKVLAKTGLLLEVVPVEETTAPPEINLLKS